MREKIGALLTLLFMAGFNLGYGQNVEWTTSLESLGGDNYCLTLEADIAEGYHIYGVGSSQWITPTVVDFVLGDDLHAVGELEVSGDSDIHFDELYGEQIEYLSGVVKFSQCFEGRGVVGVKVEWMSCSESQCFPPDDAEFTVEIGQADNSSGSTIWRTIIEAILWGFAALLTPCVFPMIPMTISFFLKGEGGEGRGRAAAILYGVFIVALYTLPIAVIIMLTRWIGGDAVMSDIFNFIATHWLPNTIFFALFLLFAASLLGAFEITLPSWIVNRSDERASRNSIGGVLFLALTLVLVSFSCTTPIVGAALISSTSGGEFFTPIVTMLAFSAAFALPFVLFALFPSLLSRLPKSGGWLNSVKVVMGFLEIALSLKFLSVADQVYHWGILPRELYLAIWIVIFSLLGLYLLGKLRFKHDSEVEYIGIGRLGGAIIVFSFVVYLITGLWGAPLPAMSGYLPPQRSKVVNMVEGQTTPVSRGVKYSDFLHLPHGLEGFFDIDQARSYAAEVDKPLLVTLTGHGCVNCREMEARVWSDERVLKRLRDDFVVVALYMDDKTPLAASQWIETSSGRTLKSLGRINAYRAVEMYGTSAQPYYIIENAAGESLAPPRGYNLNVEEFLSFLDKAL